MYLNERERTVDQRLAALERKVFGRAMGPDGSDAAREAAEAARRENLPGPSPYSQPKPGVNRAQPQKVK